MMPYFIEITHTPLFIWDPRTGAEGYGALSLSYNAVARAVTVLMEKNILEQTDKKGKTRIYTYSAYLDILRKDTE